MTRMTYDSANAVDVLWDKATTIDGQDPKIWRVDPYNIVINRYAYGDKNSSYGWEKDHIVSVANGGSHDIINLQALNFYSNRSLQDSPIKRSRHDQPKSITEMYVKHIQAGGQDLHQIITQ